MHRNGRPILSGEPAQCQCWTSCTWPCACVAHDTRRDGIRKKRFRTRLGHLDSGLAWSCPSPDFFQLSPSFRGSWAKRKWSDAPLTGRSSGDAVVYYKTSVSQHCVPRRKACKCLIQQCVDSHGRRSDLSAGGSLFQLRQASIALLGAHVPYAAADPLVEVEALIRKESQRAGLQVTDRPPCAFGCA
jgi:hypothetical protein